MLDALNRRISDKIAANSDVFLGKIFLHYSDQEHTYFEHIRDLLDDLKKYQYTVEEDRKSYPQHDDVAVHFPPYLLRILTE